MNSYEKQFDISSPKFRLKNDHLNLGNEDIKLKQIFPITKNHYQNIKGQSNERGIMIDALDYDFSNIQYQLISKENTINNLKKNNRHLKHKIQAQKSEYENKIAELEQKSKESLTKIQKLQLDISNILQQVLQAKNDDNINAKEKVQLKITIQNLTETFQTQENQYKQRIDELTKQNKEKEDEIHLKSEEIEGLKEEIELFKNKAQLMQIQKEDMKSENDLKYNHTKNLYLQSQQLVEKKEVQIQLLEEELSSIKQQNDSFEVNKMINLTIQALKSQYQTKINELKQEIRIQKEIINQQQPDDDQQMQELRDKNVNLKKNFKLKIQEKEKEIKNLNELLEEKKKDVFDKDKMISELKVVINIDHDKINRLKTENVNLINDKKIIDLFHSYYEQKSDIKNVLIKLKEIDHPFINELIFLFSQLNEKKKDSIPKMEQNLNELIEIIKNKNEENQKLTKELNDRIKELESDNQSQILISQLRKEIELKNFTIDELNKQISALKSEKIDVKNQVKNENKKHETVDRERQKNIHNKKSQE